MIVPDDRYAAGVAAEFVPVVGAASSRMGPAAVLRGVLDGGGPLFRTQAARAALDRPARANLRRELDGFAGRSPSLASASLTGSAPLTARPSA